MMAMQGFSGWRLGAWTRSVLSGGSRIGLCPPDIAGREREGCGCGRREGRAPSDDVWFRLSSGCDRLCCSFFGGPRRCAAAREEAAAQDSPGHVRGRPIFPVEWLGHVGTS